MRNVFMKFLEGEFGVENLAFYEACESLERMEANGESRKEILANALMMKRTYIASESMNCVNISAAARSETLSRMKAIEAKSSEDLEVVKISEVFTKAKKEIFRLMARDSFLRFKAQHREFFMHQGSTSKSAAVTTSIGRTSKEKPLLDSQL
jgi:hypothetical protein